MTQEKIYRGDIFFANLNPVKGSEQGGKRPVVILQNDVGNKFSPTVIVAAITSRTRKKRKCRLMFLWTMQHSKKTRRFFWSKYELWISHD